MFAVNPFCEEKHMAQNLTMSVPEAGALLGLGRNGSYKAAKRGEIPTIRIGNKLLVPRVAIQRLLNSVRSIAETDAAPVTD
jgi:excisionase family DNA binding protein